MFTEERIKEILKLAELSASLETPIGDDETCRLGDFIEDRSALSPADAAFSRLLKVQVDDVLHTLSDREARVLQLRFGLEDDPTRTLEEIGREFGVARERIKGRSRPRRHESCATPAALRSSANSILLVSAVNPRIPRGAAPVELKIWRRIYESVVRELLDEERQLLPRSNQNSGGPSCERKVQSVECAR